MTVPELRDALLLHYRDGQAQLASGTVYDDVTAFWPHFEANYTAHVVPLPTAARVLDVGCGPGSLLAWLTARGFTAVEGVDLSPEDVRFAAGYLGSDVVT